MSDRLRWSILALAQPAEIQLSLFPGFACTGDELALNLEHALEELNADVREFSPDQQATLDALDAEIRKISGPHNADFWLEDDALRSHPTWDVIRRLAQTAAIAFGWGLEPPSPTEDVYIGR